MSAGSDSSGSGSATNGSKRGVEDVHYAHEGGGGGDAETSRKKFKSEPSDRLEGLNLDTHAQGLFRSVCGHELIKICRWKGVILEILLVTL